MCGIAGRLNFEPERSVDPALLARMCEGIAHRGPDDGGIWCDGAVGLGHRLLGIVEPSPAGHQPMPNEDGSLWIALDGEIHNVAALRAELEWLGHRFRSRVDAEVVLHLYQRLGADCLHRLRGMFALAIWDARRHELFLARDRVGKKPLHYHLDDSGITFA